MKRVIFGALATMACALPGYSQSLFVPSGASGISTSTSGGVGVLAPSPVGSFQVNSYRPVIIQNNGGHGIYGSNIGFNAILNTSEVPNKFRKLGSTGQKGGAAMVVDYTGGMHFQMYDATTEAESIIDYKPQITFSNKGWLGVGTTSPGAQFTVALDGYTGTPTYSSLAFINYSANPDGNDLKPALELKNNAGSGYGLVSVAPYNYLSGNLGVGAIPLEKLHVQNGKLLIKSGVSTNNAVQPYGVKFVTDVNTNAAEILIRRGVDSGHTGLQFNTYSGTTKETLTLLDGKVGVGLVPSAKLHINGNVIAEDHIVVNKDGSYRVALNGTADGYITGRNDEVESKFVIHSDGPTYFNGGNVGIGTATPDEKLTVKGTVHAEEVKVDLNVPGPDYVFEKDYPLPSLDEVKAYIDEHKHLPEVPSAKEMEEEGVNVGEMEMILLKKIEELTLYVIEQRNLIAELQKGRKKVEELTLCVISMMEMNKAQNREIRRLRRELDRKTSHSGEPGLDKGSAYNK